MKYFLDTEFLEGPQKKWFGWSKPTIDLISIGIVCDDGREYYAVSKDFNLKEAWNRYQVKRKWTANTGDRFEEREYWIRENVILPILKELSEKENVWAHGEDQYFTYKVAKRLISKYGKSNEQIAKEIKNFVYLENRDFGGQIVNGAGFIPNKYPNPQFYAYYADYDWVAFCWLFGRMIDLPKGFPMYCRDLKQIFDTLSEHLNTPNSRLTPNEWVKMIKEHSNYPKQTNEHNALADAKWNFELYKFLKNL